MHGVSFLGFTVLLFIREHEMNLSLSKFKEEYLSTQYPKWRNILSTVILALLCGSTVGIFVYLVGAGANMQCHKSFMWFSIFWLIVELITLGYLFFWTNIPRFARDVIRLNIVFAHIWFGLFVFGLEACV